MIDDLITKGTDEPYRMLLAARRVPAALRIDNADERLTRLKNESDCWPACSGRRRVFTRKTAQKTCLGCIEFEPKRSGLRQPSEEIEELLRLGSRSLKRTP